MPSRSNDDSNLAAFGKTVGNARMVVLGPQTYGDGNACILKARMVRYLYEEKGFNILAMESGSFDAECIGEAVDAGTSYANAASDAMCYLFAEARELMPLFTYLDSTRRHPDGLRMVGFDTQQTGRYALLNLCRRLQQLLDRAAPALFDDDDWNLFCRTTDNIIEMRTTTPAIHLLARYFHRLDALKAALATLSETDGSLLASPGYWRHVLKGLEQQARHFWGLNEGSPDVIPGAIREMSMAEYLLWLANEHFCHQKIVVWTRKTLAWRHPDSLIMRSSLTAVLRDDLVYAL